MRRKIEDLRETLDEFVSQTDYSILVVGCVAEELAYVVKFLQTTEATHPEAFFLLFANEFTTASNYVDGIVASLDVQLEAAQRARAERGEKPWPLLPLALRDGREPPEKRLRLALEYLVSLLPNVRDHAVVVGLLPLQCSDVNAYAQLVKTIVPHSAAPWMASLRIVAYDDRREHPVVLTLDEGQSANVLRYEVDFSTPALMNALTQTAADTSLPVDERMTSLLQLAALDYAHRRYTQALEKYGVLHEYYRSQNLPTIQAVCLQGAGDTLRAGGQLEAAKEMLQRGIGLAMGEKALPILLNLLCSIIDLCAELGHHAEAESYADSAMKVAAAALNPYAYADLDEKKGDAQIAQGRIAEGLATYVHCAQACEGNEYVYRWKSVVRKRVTVLAREGMDRQLCDARAELARIERWERREAEKRATSADGKPAIPPAAPEDDPAPCPDESAMPPDSDEVPDTLRDGAYPPIEQRDPTAAPSLEPDHCEKAMP